MHHPIWLPHRSRVRTRYDPKGIYKLLGWNVCNIVDVAISPKININKYIYIYGNILAIIITQVGLKPGKTCEFCRHATNPWFRLRILSPLPRYTSIYPMVLCGANISGWRILAKKVHECRQGSETYSFQREKHDGNVVCTSVDVPGPPKSSLRPCFYGPLAIRTNPKGMSMTAWDLVVFYGL